MTITINWDILISVRHIVLRKDVLVNIVIQSAQKVKDCRDAAAMTDTRRKARKAMKTIIVMERSALGERERECDSFECVCGFAEDGTFEYFVYGWYFDAYFRRDRCIVGYFLDQDAAMSMLSGLNMQLEASGSVIEGVTA